MSELKILTELAAGGVTVFRLAGPLVLSTLFEFQNLARADAGSAIVVDLSGVPYMDSAGLGVLLGILASCQRRARGFGIAGVPSRIRTLFMVAHVDGLIPTYDSVEIAAQSLSKPASS
jgi:anti-sigma B factor antagonist